MRPIESIIRTVRGQKVILDLDLAEAYGVTTKVFNQAVKRNLERFPEDFAFQLTDDEYANLRSQFVTSSYGGRRYKPFAFTEHGAIMGASVLNSPRAVSVSVYVIRAFIQMREQMLAHSDILKKLAQMDKKRMLHDEALQTIWQQLQPLLAPEPTPPKRRIGFRP